MSEVAEELSRTLRAPLPDGFESLPAAQLQELNRLLETTLARRAQKLTESINASLDHTPRLLRPAVRRALGL
ncbi:hypothetical protein BST27_23320 [Mycobacterium intermedium]|uniref:Uncharacterized protein n=1 Tax=Mycobacterium intermedium TaxID=28445 RepID=A0A1E3SIN8_MYCIE|nr:hypothetical protein [Mycobacterium intermedium]MCV6967146.1 hypothetical protein [Mycobacterium intermedium]ODR01975.1 hypothetical protein BHQ20_06020 [Mycobacterium intermedium]OPE49203.1 hypothetical protein BV508_14930 [Mycobacterium intermedium]ORA97061.1 hypothetical protein BST27_23320 [Mycobacterium intermedium]